MNKRIEKWLTILALSSWVASIGAMVAIEVVSSHSLKGFASETPSSRSQLLARQSFRLNALKIESDKTLELSKTALFKQSHWLDVQHLSLWDDNILPTYNALDIDFSSSDKSALQVIQQIHTNGDRNATPSKSMVARSIP